MTIDYTIFYLKIRIYEKLCIKFLIMSTHNSILINIYIKKIKKYLLMSLIFTSSLKYKQDPISYPKSPSFKKKSFY